MVESVYSGGETSPMAIMQAFLSELHKNLEHLDLNKINIHKLFYDKHKNAEPVFESFYFNGSSKFPYSQQIEDALYEMTVCGMLTRPNPTMTKYNFVYIDNTCYDKLPTEFQSVIDSLVVQVQAQENI